MSQEDQHKRKRQRTLEQVQNVIFEYRCSRSSALVDVGSTVRRLASANADIESAVLVPLFLNRLIGPRTWAVLTHR